MEKRAYYQHWINGSHSEAEGGRQFDDLNPLDDTPFARVAQGTATDVERAVEAAHKAFAQYRHSLAKDREAWLLRASVLLAEREQEILDILVDEIGSPIGKARFEFTKAVTFMRAAAAMARQVTGQTLPSDSPGRLSLSVRRPLGVIAAITPFNVPLIKGVRLTANPLAVGNTVVLLPSEFAPAIGCVLAEIYHQAGIPAGAMNVVTGYGAEIGDELTTHRHVRMVTFTGSTVVGKHIAVLCAQHGKRVTLELGGKSPMVVLADCDLEKAVSAAVAGIFMFQGQVCMGTSRIFVEAPVFDEFCRRFTAAGEAVGRGDLRDSRTMIGPIISDRQRRRVGSHVSDALSKGARLLSGGAWEGNRCLPTILTGVTPDMMMYDQETFGPVTAIYPVQDAAEGLARANDTAYGLTAAIFTRDLGAALDFAEGADAGMVHVNGSTLQDEPHVPFGGTGDSGVGREGTGVDIDAMTEWKWVTIQR